MTSDTRAVEDPAMENQDAPMPSADQQASEVEGVDSVAQQEVPEATEDQDLSLPEDVKDRTAEQFDKLKAQLRDERLRREEAESLAYQYQYQYTPQQQQQAANAPLYDPNTGIVNIEELEVTRQRAAQAQKRAEEADRKLEKFVQQQQEREAFSAYPELDRKSKDFDSDLHRSVRALITDSIVNPKDYGNKELSMKEAADLIRGVSNKEIDKAKKAAAEQAVKQLTPKEQASLEATGRSDRRVDAREDLEDLRQRSRRGDRSAVIARLKSLNPVGS